MAKKIYINNTARAFVFGGTMLLPGSNAVDEIDASKFPQLAALMEDGCIEETDDAVKAVQKANTQKAVNDIENEAPNDESVKKAAKKRKGQLDEIDKAAREAAEKAKAEKESEE